MKKLLLAFVVAGMVVANLKIAKASECQTNEVTCWNVYAAGGPYTITKCNGCAEVTISQASVPGCCTTN